MYPFLTPPNTVSFLQRATAKKPEGRKKKAALIELATAKYEKLMEELNAMVSLTLFLTLIYPPSKPYIINGDFRTRMRRRRKAALGPLSGPIWRWTSALSI